MHRHIPMPLQSDRAGGLRKPSAFPSFNLAALLIPSQETASVSWLRALGGSRIIESPLSEAG